MNREEWLTRVASKIEPRIVAQGLTMSPYSVTVGFPSKSVRKVIGQCIYAASVKDGRHYVTVSPLRDEPLDVAAIVAHELLHVALGKDVGHKAEFAKNALALGLVGPATATESGPEFEAFISPILAKLGPYPHGAVNLSEQKKQTTRLIKVFCPEHEAEGGQYIARMSAKALEEGAPICPVHEVPMFV